MMNAVKFGYRFAGVLMLTLLGLALCAPHTPRAAQTTRRPNILWISTEDISPDLGCYGDAYAAAPNVDRLAAQGVRYTGELTLKRPTTLRVKACRLGYPDSDELVKNMIRQRASGLQRQMSQSGSNGSGMAAAAVEQAARQLLTELARLEQALLGLED